MKYQKAAAVFPLELLREIQKYVQGDLVYIPKQRETRERWGERSGARDSCRNRNEAIRRRHRAGASLEQLAGEFLLSVESIKKIVYDPGGKT